MTAKSLVTMVGVTHPWMCDAMGHVNVRHYVAMFDDASFQVLGYLATPDGKTGWADVRLEVDYLAETAADELITIRSTVTRIGNSSIAYSHEMSGTHDGIVHARATVVSVRFDLVRRAKVPLEQPVRDRAGALLVA